MAKLIDGEQPEKKETSKESGSPLILSQEEMKRLEAEAKAEINAELKADQEKRFKEQAKARLKKAELFKNAKTEAGENLEPVYVNLAPFCEDVRLDGVRYLHGRTYHVTPGVASVLKDQVDRSWQHQAQIKGMDENQLVGRQPRHVNVSGRA